MTRAQFLHEAAQIPGIYCPVSFMKTSYKEDGTIAAVYTALR